MKSFLKYSGVIALVVALVGFILLMATPSVIIASPKGLDTVSISGIDGIFGVYDTILWAGLLSWILALIGILALALKCVLSLLKVNIDKFAGLINIIAAIALVLAGIFSFFEVSAYISTNPEIFNTAIKLGTSYGLGAGWIIAGIMLIVSGACALMPKLFGLGKK